MNSDKLAVSVFVLGMFVVIPLVAVLVSMRLVNDFAQYTGRKLGLVHEPQKPKPILDVSPTGDIPQPETSNIGSKLSVPR